MKVFIYEHVCGGGLSGEALPASLAAQGGAMLTAAVGDFLDANVQVITTVDPRAGLELEGEIVTPGTAIEPIFDRLCHAADEVLVIAPETGGILEKCVRRLAVLGANSLGSSPEAISLCADKLLLAEYLDRAGVMTPTTYVFYAQRPAEYPLIVKPRFGAGCQNTFLCNCEDQVRIARVDDGWITQPWVEGEAVSVSLIIGKDKTTCLLAGRQHIELDGEGPMRLVYAGGSIPLDGALAQRAVNAALRAVSAVPGLSGFVGVDVILAGDPAGDQVVEINPRLTVSYVAMRQLCTTNLAILMLGSDLPVRWSDRNLSFDAAGRAVQTVDQ